MRKPTEPKNPRVILLSNQLSTRNRADLPNVRKVARRYPYVWHLEGQSLDRLYEHLEAFKGKTPELIILNGGDGTIHSALTFLMNQKVFKTMPAIAMLGGGMTNMNARDLRTGGMPSRSLRNILSCFDRDACEALFEERHLLKVEFSDETPPEYGMFFAGAAFVNAIRFCTTKIYGMGIKGTPSQLITVSLMLLSLIFKNGSRGSLAYSPKLTLTFDEKEEAVTNYFTLSATTLQKLLFGSRAPQMRGTFPFFTLRPSLWAAICSLFLATRGTIQNSRNRNIDLRFIKNVKIEGDTDFVVDGEIYKMPKGGWIKLSSVGPVRFVSFNKG